MCAYNNLLYTVLILALEPHITPQDFRFGLGQFGDRSFPRRDVSGMEVENVLYQGWPSSQRRRATFLTVLPQRASSYTWAHVNITHLFLTHTHTCAQLDLLQISHTNMTTTKLLSSRLLLCMLFSGTSGNYVSAAWNWAKSRGCHPCFIRKKCVFEIL